MRTASKKILASILLLPAFNFAEPIAYGQDKPPVARLSHQYSRSHVKGTQAKVAPTTATLTVGTQTAPLQAPASIKKHVTRQSLPKPSLVPPPPPGAYLGSPLDFMSGGMGVISPDYQSQAQLKQSLNDLTDQLIRGSKALDDKQTAAQERVERAKQFEALYSEGVISKRELETAQSDAASLDDGISELQAKVTLLKQNKTAVENALKKFNKNIKPESKSSSDKVAHPIKDSKTPTEK